MTYSGPKNIVILGGGLAGLAAADAVSEALLPYARAGTLPAGMQVTLVEGEDQVGGRATSWDVGAVDPQEHPHRPHAAHTPHGIHFTWHSYRHFLRFTRDSSARFSPARPTSTYCAWLAPPDVPGEWHEPGRITALHVCDPQEPDLAWDPRARAILHAFKRGDAFVGALEAFVRRTLVRDVEVDDWLSFLDILFDEEHLSPILRWGLFFGPAFATQLGQVEVSAELRALLGGRPPQDVEVSELLKPFWQSVVVERLKNAHAALSPVLAPDHGPTSIAAVDGILIGIRDLALSLGEKVTGLFEGLVGGGLSDTQRAIVELFRLILRDARVILDTALDYDPRTSPYVKNVYKAAFSSPYAFDLASALRDVQLGHRSFQTAKLQVFDGDDAQAVWDDVKQRIEDRAAQGVPVVIRTGTWAKQIHVAAGRVHSVEVTTHAGREKRPVSMVDPVDKGATSATLAADVVVSSLLPACLKRLLPRSELRRRLGLLAPYANETVNLQLFFDKKLALPFVDPPNAVESRPLSISNLEGLFTILVDLRRAWHAPSFEAIRLDASSTGPFDGTAWELVGAWADVFTHDDKAAPGRVQWPVGVQHVLAQLAHDPMELEPWSVDERAWAFDVGAPGSLSPPVFGQVKPAARAAYFARWVHEVGPLVVEQTLRHIAAMPALGEDVVEHLKDVANKVGRGEPAPIKWVFSRSCQAETRFFSAEPRLYALRPHARYELDVGGLWCCGDWTRNGVNVQAMEAAVVSGLQSAAGVVEAIRAGGLADIKGPRIEPSSMPNGAWDPGP